MLIKKLFFLAFLFIVLWGFPHLSLAIEAITISHVSQVVGHNLTDSATGPVSYCLTGENHYNKWYAFVATDTMLSIQLEVGDSNNSLSHTYLSLWNDHEEELDCRKYRVEAYNLSIERNDLEIGKTYYIAVDNADFAAYRGYFTLILDTLVKNDFKEAPLLLSHSYLSPKAYHTTMNGSPDGIRASCWTTGPNYNKWFKFIAETEHLHLELKAQDSYGDIEKPYLALWDTLGHELACARFSGTNYNIQLTYRNLTIGESYLISVDNSTQTSYIGSFTLNSYDYIAVGVDAGASLFLNAIDFQVVNRDEEVCLELDVDEVSHYIVEYTEKGEVIEATDVVLNDCYAPFELRSGYYRLKDTLLNDYTEWQYWDPSISIGKHLKGIYTITGKEVLNDQHLSTGYYLFLYDQGGKSIRERQFKF